MIHNEITDVSFRNTRIMYKIVDIITLILPNQSKCVLDIVYSQWKPILNKHVKCATVAQHDISQCFQLSYGSFVFVLLKNLFVEDLFDQLILWAGFNVTNPCIVL